MKTLNKIISGIALAGALAFGYEANAQTKIATETSVTNNVHTALPFQRLQVNSGNLLLKYDKTTPINNAKDPDDAGAIFFNNLYSDNTASVNAYAINLGNFKREDEQFFGAWASGKFGKTEITLEAGKSARKTGPSREWGIA